MMKDDPEADADRARIRIAYCPACDREVRIRVENPAEPDEATDSRQTLISGICLDVGDDCTGAFCPFGEQPEV